MVQKVQDILISIFGWVIGPMVTAILAITVMNYQATLNGNKIFAEYKLQQEQQTKYVIHRLYTDSLELITLREYLSFIQKVVKKSNPELYEKMVAECIETDYGEQAILPKNKYKLLNK